MEFGGMLGRATSFTILFGWMLVCLLSFFFLSDSGKFYINSMRNSLLIVQCDILYWVKWKSGSAEFRLLFIITAFNSNFRSINGFFCFFVCIN